jgi:hypothetical protein
VVAAVLALCQAYCMSPYFLGVLQSLIVGSRAKASLDMASCWTDEGGPVINAVVNLFVQFNRLQECTSILRDALSGEKHEQDNLQPRLLEFNLFGDAPALAGTILGLGVLSHCTKPHIARTKPHIARPCGKVGLIQRAVDLYPDLVDFKRCIVCIVRTNATPPGFMVQFLGKLKPTSTWLKRCSLSVACDVASPSKHTQAFC